MKIAFFVKTFPTLSETFILNQIIGLIDRGHHVDIYAEMPSNEPRMHLDIKKYNLLNHTYYYPQIPNNLLPWQLLKGVGLLFANFFKDPVLLLRSLNIFKYGKKAASFRILYLTIPLLGKRPKYDIIQCHFGGNGLKATFLKDIGAIQGKLITTFHGFDLSRFVKTLGDRIYDPLFDKGNLFLSISEFWRLRLIELGCDPEKIIVHRMGIDCSKFAFAYRKLSTGGAIQIVTIARLVEKKGVEYGVRAVAKLAKNNRDIQYNIVGDGDLREPLEQLIQELAVGDIVKLIGWKRQQEIIEILNNTDILLAPSITSQKDGDQEGIPVVLMEAMAMGLPIISTQHSGIPELVQNGVSGFLVPERDVEKLTEKLNYLLEHPEICTKMGQEGRSYVKEHHNIDKLNDKLVEIYTTMINSDVVKNKVTL